ncbi:DUF445 family protein [Pelosinus sp. sgz500959]|uniref:DUF445 family protein n=1 Tax=Pelosinus sp. sgz500959 TaxID=3242472 RepID=UPI00366EAFB2
MNSKNIANKVLLVVCFLFLLSIGLKYFYKGKLIVEMFYAVMEAALVGGVADWFAITAIFKKPLGFPWHTALIPRHRERMIGAIRSFIDQDLLNVESIKKRVDHTCFVTLVIGFIENKRSQFLLRSWLEKSYQEVIANLDFQEIVGYLDIFVRKEIRNINTISQLKSLVRWLLNERKVQVFTTYIVIEVINQLEKIEIKEKICKHIEELAQGTNRSSLERVFIWLGEQTNSVNISDAVETFYGEIVTMLQEIKNPEHILHTWIDEKLTNLVEQPEMNIAWFEQIESWKVTLANDVKLNEVAMQMVDDFSATKDPKLYTQLIDWVCSQIHEYWEFFKGNNEIQEWLEVRIKQATYQFIEKEHYIIGEMVQRVLSEFTDDKLNDFVEDKAGDDFQWIRINGSVVGGIVGLVVFLFLHYFYNDYIVPMIQGW